MTLTTIDRVPALIIIDLQTGLLGAPTAHPLDDVIDNARRLAEEFRKRRFPVVLVGVEGTPPGRTDATRSRGSASTRPEGFSDPAPRLGAHPDDHRVIKHAWSAFPGTELPALLRAADVTQVVVTGVATSIGVDSTARSAYEEGYNVVLATDAMTDLDLAAHDHTIEKIFPRLGENASTNDIIDMISAD
jgi:nicotinamidase-related amidase